MFIECAFLASFRLDQNKIEVWGSLRSKIAPTFEMMFTFSKPVVNVVCQHLDSVHKAELSSGSISEILDEPEAMRSVF